MRNFSELITFPGTQWAPNRQLNVKSETLFPVESFKRYLHTYWEKIQRVIEKMWIYAITRKAQDKCEPGMWER